MLLGFVLTVGDFTGGLFGDVFPACGLISAEGEVTIDAADCAVILCKSSPKINIKNALGVISTEIRRPKISPTVYSLSLSG